MKHTTTIAAAITGLAASVSGETVHGALIFTRHGDRTTKHYGNQQLTPLGQTQCFSSGQFYRNLYLSPASSQRINGISEIVYSKSQLYASAPDQDILLNTATSFLQGLYPPVPASVHAESLANGSEVEAPLDGYQYVTLHGVDKFSPDTIWLKGDESCPAANTAQKSYQTSEEFKSLESSTKDFYQSLYPYLADVYDITEQDLSYKNAYDLYDLLNVASIHNSSSAATNLSSETLHQLKTLADKAELGTNFDFSKPQGERSMGAMTFAAAVVAHLSKMVESQGEKQKLTVLSGSYDTFLAFFGWAELLKTDKRFYGLPEYAATMTFEVFSDSEKFAEEDLKVRFLFRNGTDSDAKLEQFPLFGKTEQEMRWTQFVQEVQGRGAMTTAQDWCGRCQSSEGFCKVYEVEATKGEDKKDGGMEGEMIAGIVMIVVGGLALASAAVMFLFVARRKKEREKKMVKGKVWEDAASV
ncbi:histidine phosphatase superfamily [Podospora australis]|uniref:Histidine phosphatase superfamily n=1 Tax=Podospora australis TaxID=1536484 RepID=A0AAN7AK16_9PEZI|nr:histidine phosphatase superfamily [Podospora australis]